MSCHVQPPWCLCQWNLCHASLSDIIIVMETYTSPLVAALLQLGAVATAGPRALSGDVSLR